MSNLELKKEKVKLIEDNFRGSEALIISDYQGLSVSDMTELRGQVREKGFSATVIKNRLFDLAAKNIDYEIPKELLKGQNIFFKAEKDVVELSKILIKFSKSNENLKVKGGVLDGKYITDKEVDALSKLPSKDELIAKTVGLIKGPLTGLVGTLSNPINGFINVLNNIKNNK
jgi:large subunit ribosomal protein L10